MLVHTRTHAYAQSDEHFIRTTFAFRSFFWNVFLESRKGTKPNKPDSTYYLPLSFRQTHRQTLFGSMVLRWVFVSLYERLSMNLLNRLLKLIDVHLQLKEFIFTAYVYIQAMQSAKRIELKACVC